MHLDWWVGFHHSCSTPRIKYWSVNKNILKNKKVAFLKVKRIKSLLIITALKAYYLKQNYKNTCQC